MWQHLRWQQLAQFSWEKVLFPGLHLLRVFLVIGQ